MKELTDEELLITSKSLDIHRQSMLSKLLRLGDAPSYERERTLNDIRLCDAASHKIKQAQTERLGDE